MAQTSSGEDRGGESGEGKFSWRVGWRPVGSRKEVWKTCEEGSGWCLEGKENSVEDGCAAGSSVMRWPERVRSYGSPDFSREKTPISTGESLLDAGEEIDSVQPSLGFGACDRYALTVRVCDMLLKSMSSVSRPKSDVAASRQETEECGQTCFWM